jgi:hypothetical protein
MSLIALPNEASNIGREGTIGASSAMEWALRGGKGIQGCMYCLCILGGIDKL